MLGDLRDQVFAVSWLVRDIELVMSFKGFTLWLLAV